MAPRALESKEQFIARLEREAKSGRKEIRFGGHHFTHAVCLEEGKWRLRRLEYTREEADAFLAKHNMFMPENAEEISKPRTLVFEADSLAGVIEKLKATPQWPPGL